MFNRIFGYGALEAIESIRKRIQAGSPTLEMEKYASNITRIDVDIKLVDHHDSRGLILEYQYLSRYEEFSEKHAVQYTPKLHNSFEKNRNKRLPAELIMVMTKYGSGNVRSMLDSRTVASTNVVMFSMSEPVAELENLFYLKFSQIEKRLQRLRKTGNLPQGRYRVHILPSANLEDVEIVYKPCAEICA